MRILTFTTIFPNKAEPQLGIFIFRRILHLAMRPKNQVEVISPLPFFPRWLRWGKWHAIANVPREEQFRSLSVHHPRYFLLPRISMPLHGLLMFLGSLFTARRLHRRAKFDCIDAHFVYPDGTAAVLLGKVLGVPVVVSARGTDINLFPTFRLIRPIIRWTLQNASGAIAVSESLKRVMMEMGLPAAKIRVIGNGIDPELFAPVDPQEARKQINLPKEGAILVSVGKLLPLKGFQYLIPAFAEMAPRFPNARLYIIGEGSFRSELERLIEKMKIQDRVFLIGSRPNEELKFWFSAAEASCLVSSREGWPNVLQESLACGTPVVATRVWGAPEVITSSELGILVEQNVPAIAGALDGALSRRWNRNAIATHARERTWEVVASEVDEYLTQSVEDARKPKV